MDAHSDRALAGAADGPDQSVDLDEGTAARRRRRRRGRVIAGLVLVSATVIAWGGAGQDDTVMLAPNERDAYTSGDASSDESGPTPPASTAVELCRGAGQQQAETVANVQAIDAVYRTRAANMAAWRASGTPDDPHTPWRDHPDDQLVAVCIFDAADIQAPAGPTLGQDEKRAPYDKLTVGAADDGTVRLLTAIRSNAPPDKTYAPEDHAPPGSERVQ